MPWFARPPELHFIVVSDQHDIRRNLCFTKADKSSQSKTKKRATPELLVSILSHLCIFKCQFPRVLAQRQSFSSLPCLLWAAGLFPFPSIFYQKPFILPVFYFCQLGMIFLLMPPTQFFDFEKRKESSPQATLVIEIPPFGPSSKTFTSVSTKICVIRWQYGGRCHWLYWKHLVWPPWFWMSAESYLAHFCCKDARGSSEQRLAAWVGWCSCGSSWGRYWCCRRRWRELSELCFLGWSPGLRGKATNRSRTRQWPSGPSWWLF